MSDAFRDHEAGNSVVALLAGLPPHRRQELRALVRDGRTRLNARRETREGEMEMEFDREAAVTLEPARSAPGTPAPRSAGAGAPDWREAERKLERLRAAGRAEEPAPRRTRPGNDASGPLERHVVRFSAIAPACGSRGPTSRPTAAAGR